MKTKLIFVMALLLSALVLQASNVSMSDTTAFTLDGVTVTSLYRPKAGTNNSFKASDITEVNHGQSLDYLISRFPNVFAYGDTGTDMGYNYIRLRGMGQERMNITLDGMPWNESEDFGCYFSNMPDMMSSMHEINVFNGAAVTSNGTAAYAGNIAMESVNLKTDTISYAEFGAGTFNSYKLSTVYNMGVKKGWGLHVKATHQQTDGYKENVFNNSQNLTLKVGKFFNSKHSLDLLTMNGFHRNGQGYMGVTEDQLPTSMNPFKQILSGNRQTETDNFYTTYNRLQYKGTFSDNLFFTSSLYYSHQTGDYRVGWDDEEAPTGKVLNNYHLNFNMVGVMATTKWLIRDNFSLIGGVNADYYKRTHTGYDIANTDSVINIWHPNGVESFYKNSGVKPEVNVFTTLNYNPFSKFNISGSVQYRTTQLKYVVHQPAFMDTEYDKNFRHTWNFVNYGFTIDYGFDEHNTIYAKYSETNREPSRTDLFGGEYITIDSPLNTDHERVNDVEVGYNVKYNRIKGNINYYYMNFKDELVATGELSPINFLPIHEQMNTYRTGIEASLSYNPFKTFNIIASGAWSINKIKDLKTDNTFSPKWIAFGEVNYTFGKLKIGANVNYRSKMYMDVNNDFSIRPAFTLNAYGSITVLKNVDLSLFLNNITNRLNISNGTTDGVTPYYLVDNPFSFFVDCKIFF